jgi:endonuclease-3
MAPPSRTAQLTRLYKILKKHYTPVSPDPSRSVLEHLLFASCLENAHAAAAEEAFGGLVHTFFDWNEIRVSSIRELSEVMAGLPDPPAAANRVKRVLQSVFEATYCFDLEDLRKQNLGPAVDRLKKIEGTTGFTVAYVVQAALAGHAIPIDAGTLGVLRLVDLVTEKDAAEGVVPGLERAISKQHGLDFGSLVHQIGADYVAGPFRPELHGILLEIEPAAKDRLPTRRARRAEREAAAEPGVAQPAGAPPSAAGTPRAGKAPRHAEGKHEVQEPPKEPGKSAKEPARKPAKEPAKANEPSKEETAKTATREAAGEAKRRPAAAAKPQEEAADPSLKKKETSAKDLPAEEKKAQGAKKKSEPAAENLPAKKKPPASKPASDAETGRPASPAEGLSKRKPR